MFDDFPEFLNAKDIVKLGLFPNTNALYRAISRGSGSVPPYIKLGENKLRFLKKDLIEWVKDKHK